jgi:hypothetical protein
VIEIKAELHVHTVLSPCAEVEMIPPLIVQAALEQGITLIAITDHNSTRNVRAVQLAAAGSGLTVLPGMEVQSREEVHLLALFPSLEASDAFQFWVDAALPDLENQPEHFGEQFIVDETGGFLAREPRLLLTSCSHTLEQIVARVNQLGGLAIPAHIDRTTFGLVAQLGFVPAGAGFAAVEISRRADPAKTALRFPFSGEYPLIQSGDVHRLEEFLGSTHLCVEAPTLTELRLALRQSQGRRCWIEQAASQAA